MIKRHLQPGAVVLLAALAASSCDRDAREFARKVQQLLTERSKELAGKIAAERTAYNSFAAHAAEDHRALVESSLQNERNERSDVLAADYAEGRRPVSMWRRDLAEYAKADYDANRGLLTGEIDASSAYLQTLAGLTIE